MKSNAARWAVGLLLVTACSGASVGVPETDGAGSGDSSGQGSSGSSSGSSSGASSRSSSGGTGCDAGSCDLDATIPEDASDATINDVMTTDTLEAGSQLDATEDVSLDAGSAEVRAAGDASDGGTCSVAISTCCDGIQDGDESDVDCGGSCPGCPTFPAPCDFTCSRIGYRCRTNSDCASGFCSSESQVCSVQRILSQSCAGQTNGTPCSYTGTGQTSCYWASCLQQQCEPEVYNNTGYPYGNSCVSADCDPNTLIVIPWNDNWGPTDTGCNTGDLCTPGTCTGVTCVPGPNDCDAESMEAGGSGSSGGSSSGGSSGSSSGSSSGGSSGSSSGGGAGDAGDGGVCSGTALTNAPFAVGTGTTADPYQICTLAQLNNIRGAYLANQFSLMADIDASATNPSALPDSGSSGDAGGFGWEPIGNCGPDSVCNNSDDVPFTGTFAGNGHSLANLYVNRPTTNGVGLFGIVTGSTVAVSGLRIVNATVTGQDDVGSAVGYLLASLDQCTSSGVVTASTTSTGGAGGLVGFMGTAGGPSVARSISQSSSSSTVSGGGDLGGLVGHVEWGSTVTECFATGAVSGQATQVGGLVGYSYESAITDSYGGGAVIGQSCSGGLIGMMDFSTVTNAYAAGDVSATEQAGALIGCGGNTPLTAAFATGNVTGSSEVGGLFGEEWGDTITNSKWDSTPPRPTVMCGYIQASQPGTGCDDTQSIASNPTYWYSSGNAPMNAWSATVWAFHSGSYPTLLNAFPTP